MWNKMKGKMANKEAKVWFMEAQKSTQVRTRPLISQFVMMLDHIQGVV
jgi:hypothetical protein